MLPDAAAIRVNRRRVHPNDAVDFLLREGLLTAEDVLDGHLSVEDIVGRNDNLLVRSLTGRSYALKHAAEGGAASRMLAFEAALYERVSGERAAPEFAALARHLPRFALFDHDSAVLVTHLVPDAHEVGELDASSERLPEIGAALGEALLTCHEIAAEAIPEPFRTRRSPWILGVHRQDPSIINDAFPAQLAIIRLVQANTTVCATLDRLQKAWKRERLIHGDLKFINLLVRTASATNTTTGVILLDWETVSLGDPAWDVGSVFQSVLWNALYSVFVTGEDSTGDAREGFAQRLDAYRCEIHAFWRTYRGSLSPEVAVPLLERSTEWCGVRLLQSAYEEAADLEDPSILALALLQLGVNILANPHAASRDLLGLAQ